jgi:hypothetical protein
MQRFALRHQRSDQKAATALRQSLEIANIERDNVVCSDLGSGGECLRVARHSEAPLSTPTPPSLLFPCQPILIRLPLSVSYLSSPCLICTNLLRIVSKEGIEVPLGTGAVLKKPSDVHTTSHWSIHTFVEPEADGSWRITATRDGSKSIQNKFA